MSVASIAARVEGGMPAVIAALDDPRVRAAASARGIDLSDLGQLTKLLATVNQTLGSPPPPRLSLDLSSMVTTPLMPRTLPGQTVTTRDALKAYRTISRMT